MLCCGRTTGVLTCDVRRHVDEQERTRQPGCYITMRQRGISWFVLGAGLAVLLMLLGARLLDSYPSCLLWQRQGDRAMQWLDCEAAERAYLRAWKSDTLCLEAAMAFGDLCSARATWNARRHDSLSTQAISWHHRAHAINPYVCDVLVRIARIDGAFGQRDQADTELHEALQGDPKNASYYAQLDWHYQRRENVDQVRKSFRAARQLDSFDVLPMAKSDAAGS